MAKSKAKQEREQSAKGPKNPKVPIFPRETQALVERLKRMLDETSGDQRSQVYGLLTRICVMWAQPSPPEFKVTFDANTGLLHYDTKFMQDTIDLMMVLFPDGMGMPESQGCGPL